MKHLSLILLLFFSSSCTRKCKSGTLRLSLTGANLASADAFEVTLDQNAPATGIPTDKIGATATLEVDLSDYATNKIVMVRVRAMSKSVPFAGGTMTLALDDSCTVATLALSAANIGTASATQSTISATPSSGVVADGMQTASIAVTLRDATGVVLPNKDVTFEASGSQNSIVQPMPTASDGSASGTLASTMGESKVVSVIVDGELLGSASVSFVAAPAVITQLSVTPGSDPRCMAVSYTVAQVGSQPVDVAFAFTDRGKTTVIANSNSAQVATSPEGTPHSFAWPASQQLPGIRTVSVVATPMILGAPGTAKSVSLTVNNQAQFVEQLLVTFATGRYISSAAVGHFDNDAFNDIAVATGTSVDIYFGGSLQTLPMTSNIAGSTPSVIAAGDFDHDGQTDLAVAGDSGAHYFFEKITRAQGTPISVALTSSSNSQLVTGDFNGDGYIDLASQLWNPSAMPSSTISIVYGGANGTLTPSGVTGTEDNFISLTPFATSAGMGLAFDAEDSPGSGRLSTLVNTGNDSHNEAMLEPKGVVALYYSLNMANGKLDADANDDLALLIGQTTITLRFGNGDGTFLPQPLSYSAGAMNRSIAIADMNLDGAADIIVGYEDPISSDGPHARFAILLGNGDGTFEDGGNFAIASDHLDGQVGYLKIMVADMNNDGFPDVIGADGDTKELGIALNQQTHLQCP